MQRKTSLRHFSESHVVYDAVERFFESQNIALPTDWEALVALACFPKEAVEQMVCYGYESEKNTRGEWVLKRDAKTGEPVKAYRKDDLFKDKIRAFRELWARDPDLTLKILCFARETLARLKNPRNGTDQDKVRNFILKHHTFVRENGELRLPKAGEIKVDGKLDLIVKRGLKIVGIHEAGDNELAALIFGSRSQKVQTVKKARQSMSYKVKRIKGRKVLLLPDWPAGKD